MVALFKRLVLSILRKVFILVRTRRIRKITIWKPANIRVSRDARISIEKRFVFNPPWNKRDKSSLGNISIGRQAELSIGDVRFYFGCTLAVDGKFSMKSGYVNHYSKIFCRNQISIGENVVIAPEVIIRDSDQHQIIDPEGNKKPLSAPIQIGDHVWIGTRAVILKGVHIGSNVVIAAGALVTRDIPDNCLAVGVPAKVIKSGITWE